MSDRAKIKRGIIERLDGLNDKQLRSVYIFALQESTREYTDVIPYKLYPEVIALLLRDFWDIGLPSLAVNDD